jgi:ankyrin repeat protein
MAVVLAVSSNPSLAHRADGKGGTALHYAARSGSVAVCRALLGKCPEARREADVNAASTEGYSPLILAVRGGHGELVQYLLQNGAHLAGTDANGLNALHHAVLSKRPALLELALGEARDCRDGTPLGDLLAAVDRQGLTPLALATERQSKGVPPEMVVLLRAAGAEAFLTSCAAGDTSRVKASLAEDPALKAARDPTSAFTAVMAAALGASVSSLEALKAVGADLNAVDGNGRTALMLAARAGQSHICAWLLGAGAKAGAKDEEGFTALHHAAKAVVPSASATVKELLAAGASAGVNRAAKCGKGRLPVDYARTLFDCGVHASDECVKMLK